MSDDNFAPETAVKWMVSQYAGANKKEICLTPKDFNAKKIGHFGVFREKFKNNI